MASSTDKGKLTIAAYSDAGFKSKVKSFTVSINPEEYTHNYAIKYTKSEAAGTAGEALKFNVYGGETVSFTIWFDGTGAVPGSPKSDSTSIDQQIKDFRDAVFPYDGSTHGPNYLELTWGTLLFKCVITTLDFTYTLFNPDGEPVRASCKATFRRYASVSDLEKLAANSSPDMSHLVTVKAGDTLPLLCHRIYGSSTPYTQVARVNGLSGFRALTPGTRLLFPPLRQPAR